MQTTTKPNYDHLFYLRVTEACNLTCDHCFIPKNAKKMDSKDFEHNVLSHIHQHSKAGDTILIQFHGGEPTLFGKGRVVEYCEKLSADKSRRYLFSIQTNLVNFDEEWAEIYKKYFNGEVGVSWDYEIRRLKGSNDDFEAIFWDKLRLARQCGLTINLVITTTKPFFDWMLGQATEFFDKLVEIGVNDVQLERITKVGWARDNWARIGVSNEEYSLYMSILYQMHKDYIVNTKSYLPISPLSELEQTIKRYVETGEVDAGRTGCSSGVCDSRFHTIDANGYKVGCTALNSESDNSRANNSEVAIRFFSTEEILKVRESRTVDCATCEHQAYCNSGCISIAKVDASGECSGSKKLLNSIKRNIIDENL